ncbi:MAG: hypothetical protein ACRD0J_11270, partial [Acidimicrobiales bacterium]
AQARADALVAMAETVVNQGIQAHPGSEAQVVGEVDLEVLTGEDPGGTCQLRGGPALAREPARRLRCDAGIVRLLALL